MSSFKDAPPARIAVIGGGVSGLSVCYKLNQLLPEERIHLYESSSRLGGQVGSLKKDGFIFELGPDCFIKEKPFPLQLAEETGNKEAIITTNEKNRGTFVYSRGKLHELPDGMMSFVPTKFLPFLKTGLFTWRGKLRMAFDLFLPRGQNDDPTLAAFVGRRFGWEAVDRLAAPLIAGIYGSDSEELSLKATFPRFLEMEEKYRSLIIGFLKARRTLQRTKDNYGLSYFLSFKDGMQQLVEILKANIQNTHVFLQRQVLRISIEEGRIAVIDSKGRKNFYQAVIVAVPAFEAVNMLPESLETARRLLMEIRYNSVATVNLVFKKEVIERPLQGHGFVVAENEDLMISAATFMNNKWPYRAPDGYYLIRTFIGGGKRSYLAALSEEELIEISINDLRKVLRIKENPLEAKVNRALKALPLYAPGHLARVKTILKEISKIRGLFLTGAAFRGIGVPDCMRQGFETAASVADLFKSR